MLQENKAFTVGVKLLIAVLLAVRVSAPKKHDINKKKIIPY